MACARAIVDGAKQIDLDVRAGIHTGECELVGEKIAGIAVVVIVAAVYVSKRRPIAIGAEAEAAQAAKV